MRVLFRTDASVILGTGHVIRCLTLADALRANGVECIFICSDCDGNLIKMIRSRGYVTHAIPLLVEEISTQDFSHNVKLRYQESFGFWWAKDANQVRGLIGDMKVDWLIVDHYALDARWESSLRPFCKNLMAIDDIANREHDCDLLLDQNYEDFSRYADLVPSHSSLLLGPKYALLRPEFAEFRRVGRSGLESINKILIFFGGSDPFNLSELTLKALSSPGLDYIEVDIVVGANYQLMDSLSKLALLRGKTRIHKPRDNLVDLMAGADMAIGACGVSNWERLCMGLPSMVISVAENQTRIAEILNSKGAIRFLGRAEDITESYIISALIDEIKSLELSGRSPLGMALCDGLGVHRVLKAMDAFK